MQQSILYALVAVGAISAGTIGFANTLTVSGQVNPIGGADSSVDAPGATISAVTWNEVASTGPTDGDIELGSADITVDNASGSTHSYEACVVVSDGAAVASVIGCQTTASILTGFDETITATFATPFDTIVATQLYITLEELD